MDHPFDRRQGSLLMRTGFTAVCALLGACTFNWTEDAPTLALVGAPPSLSAYTKLNRVISGRATLLTVPDDEVQWAAMCEFWQESSGNGGRNCKRLYLVRLSPDGDPPADETIEASTFEFHGGAIYAFRDDDANQTRTLTVHRVGTPPTWDLVLTLPFHPGYLAVNDAGDGDTFLYLVQDKATTQFDVFHRPDGKRYSVPLPVGVDPTGTNDARPLSARFTADGATLVARTSDGALRAYLGASDAIVDFGKRPTTFVLDEPRQQVVTCGDDGIRVLPLRQSAAPNADEGVLESQSVDPVNLSFSADHAYYSVGGALRRVALRGDSASELVHDPGARTWALSPSGLVAYSTQSAITYSANAGDGWIGARRIMERGRRLTFSSDERRVRYLENAATLGGYGDLTSRQLPDGEPQTLGINVAAYVEVASGKLVAVENAVYRGSWNRLVAIDDVAGEKRWIAEGASNFVMTSDRRTLIADVVTGASGYDVYRIAAP